MGKSSSVSMLDLKRSARDKHSEKSCANTSAYLSGVLAIKSFIIFTPV
jgi:hypothetical protein